MNKEILAAQMAAYQIFIAAGLLLACAFLANASVPAFIFAGSIIAGFLTLGAFISSLDEGYNNPPILPISNPLVRILQSSQSLSFFAGLIAFILSMP